MQKVVSQTVNESSLLTNVKLPTTIGCGALAVWSVYAFVVSELLIQLPVFQTLFLMFGISFVAMCIRLTITKRWYLLKQPWLIWIIGVIGVCGSDVAYISAVKYAPPAHVDFIDYLWPFFVILFAGFLPKEKFSLQHIIAGLLGFLGVFLLLTGGDGFIGIKPEYMTGYIFAFTAAIIWSLYTLINRCFEETPIEMVGMYCGIGAVLSLVLHFHFESWVLPSFKDGCLVGILGLSSGVAYLLWSYGTQKGNLKLLGVLAYFTPILSMGLLVFSGKEPLSYALIFACILVVVSVVIGGLDWSKIIPKLINFKQTILGQN